MHIGIVVVEDDMIVAVDDSPAFNAGDDGRFATQFGFSLNTADELGAYDTFVHEFVAGFQLSLRIPLRHAGGGTRAAGRTVDGFIPIKYRIARRGCGVNRIARPENMAQAVDRWVLGMYKRVSFVDALAQYPRPGDKLLAFKML